MAFLRGLLTPWLQKRNQFLHLDDPEASWKLDALYRRAMEETARVLTGQRPLHVVNPEVYKALRK